MYALTRSALLQAVLLLIGAVIFTAQFSVSQLLTIPAKYKIDKITGRNFGDGTSTGSLLYPTAMAISNNGEIYISEAFAIRKITVDGIYQSVIRRNFTLPAYGAIFHNPGRLSLSPYDGLLYAIDYTEGKLYQFTSDNQPKTIFGKRASFSCPEGSKPLDCYVLLFTDFKIDPRNGDIYLATITDNRSTIKKLSNANQNVSTIATIINPYSMSLSLVGDSLYVGTDKSIYCLDLPTGNLTLFTTVTSSIVAMEFCENGDYYYAHSTSAFQVSQNNTRLIYTGKYIKHLTSSKNCSEIFVTESLGAVYKIYNNQTSIVAGNGNPSVTLENVPAIEGGVSNPSSLLLDDNGDLLIADSGAGRIRKVSFTTGLISTIAGNGNTTFNGHGLSSIDSNITPTYMALSRETRELYFTDQNAIIRKINRETKNVEFVAGAMPNTIGDGNDAKFALVNRPISAISLPNGEIVISEEKRIRKIHTNGLITTIAGGDNVYIYSDGPAFDVFIQPRALAYHNETGDIYFIDGYSHIRKLEYSTNYIRTLLPNTGPRHISIVANDLFYSSSNNRLWKIDLQTQEQTLIAGGGQTIVTEDGDGLNLTDISLLISQFSISNSGDIYFIGGEYNTYIRCISPISGKLITLAGNAGCSNSSDGAIAKNSSVCPSSVLYYEPTGEVYFTEGGTIRKIGQDGRLYKVVGNNYYQNNPILDPKEIGSIGKINVNSRGDLYFTEILRNRVQILLNETKALKTIVNGNGYEGSVDQAIFSYASRIAFTKSDELLVQSNDILKVSNGRVTPQVILPNARSSPWHGMIVSELDGTVISLVNPLYKCFKYNLLESTFKVLAGTSVSGRSKDGTNATNAMLSLSDRSLTQMGNGEIYFQDDMKLRKIGLDGKLWTVSGTGVRSYMGGNELSTFSDSSIVNLDVFYDLIVDNKTGKFYVITSNSFNPQVFSMTPYCSNSGYAFADAFKTTCMTSCFGIAANQPNVCSGRGTCSTIDVCICRETFVGSDCSQSFCDTPAGKGTLICPSSDPSSTFPETLSSTIEIVSNLQTLNNRTVSFTSNNTIGTSIKIDLPSTLSEYLSKQVSEPIQLVSVVSKQVDQPIIEINVQDNTTVTTTVLTSVVTLLFLKTSDGGKVNVQNLEQPISFSFSNVSISSNLNSSNLLCSYFDQVSKTWKFDGLETQIISFTITESGSSIFSAVCKSNHLTSFAVIDQNLKKPMKNAVGLDLNNTNLIVAVVVSVVGGLCVLGVVTVIFITVCVVLSRRKKKGQDFAN